MIIFLLMIVVMHACKSVYINTACAVNSPSEYAWTDGSNTLYIYIYNLFSQLEYTSLSDASVLHQRQNAICIITEKNMGVRIKVEKLNVKLYAF